MRRRSAASSLSIRGESPKFVERLARVGAATLWAPTRPVSTRAIVPLPARLRTIEEGYLLLAGVAAEDVAERLLERVD